MLDRVVVLDPGAQVLEGCGCVPALVGSVHEVDGPDSRPQCVNFGSQSSGQGHGSISAQSSLTQNDKGRTRKSNPRSAAASRAYWTGSSPGPCWWSPSSIGSAAMSRTWAAPWRSSRTGPGQRPAGEGPSRDHRITGQGPPLLFSKR